MPTFDSTVCNVDLMVEGCGEMTVSSGLNPHNCVKNSRARRPSQLCQKFRRRSWNFESARATSRSVSRDRYFEVRTPSS